MPTYRLVAKVDADADHGFLVRSPAVGVLDGVPAKGVYLNPSDGFARLVVLGRRHVVLLPRHVQGTVVEQLVEDTTTAVGYGQPLLRLGPVRELGPASRPAGAEGANGATNDDLVAVTSPSDGVFYRRPTPESPAYVEEGSAIAAGTVLGLVEVMKCFNQIAYGGPALPERGTIERVLVGDACEVAYGQTLFLVRGS
jgi:acetyl-CoA carboxylase biotin carboxyl carrier protein